MEDESVKCYSRSHPNLVGFFCDITSESSLHGVKYLGLPDRNKAERIFWIIAVVLSFGFATYLVIDVYEKYLANPVIISFQPKETSISQIPFPAITFCNTNILKRAAMTEVLENLKMELNGLKKTHSDWNHSQLKNASMLAEHLSHFCYAAPSFRREIDDIPVEADGKKDLVERLNEFLLRLDEIIPGATDSDRKHDEEENRDARRFYHQAAHHCEDMIIKCKWFDDILPCNEMFFHISTVNGACCVFNMMPKYMLRYVDDSKRADWMKSKDTKDYVAEWKKFKPNHLIVDLDDNLEQGKYPRRQLAGGKPYGLSILVNPELDVYSSCSSNDAWGLKMVAHSPISFPTIREYGVAIPPSSEVFIDVEPQVTTADETEFKSVDVDKRGCLLLNDNEAKLDTYNVYTAANCYDDCVAKYTFAKCSCVRYFMPRSPNQKLCGAKRRKCAKEARVNITTKGLCSGCLPACTEIKYKLQVSNLPLRTNDTWPYLFYNTSTELNKTARNYSIVHIYVGTDSLNVKERKKLYDTKDLLANAGGLLGLALGFSVISVVEIFYFFTLRAWYRFNKIQQAKQPKSQSDTIEPWKSLGSKMVMEVMNYDLQSTKEARKILMNSNRSIINTSKERKF